MFICVIKDILNIVPFLPWALLAGTIFLCICFFAKGRLDADEDRLCLRMIWYALLVAYLVMLFQIVFFSREAGSRIEWNLVVGGTWTEDPQGRAYVIENILLFIPFGMLLFLCWRNLSLVVSGLLGFGVSLSIEFLQLLTARGYFQVDDLIMNTLGYLLGRSAVWLCYKIYENMKGRE